MPVEQNSDLKLYPRKIIEAFKEDINNSLKETQEYTVKNVDSLKEEACKSLKDIEEKYNQTGEGNEQNSPRHKNENKNNKEITNGGNCEDAKHRKENRSYKCKHH